MSTKDKGEQTREKILNYIIKYILKHGYPPTVREIGEGIGLRSTSTVQAQIKKMLETRMLESDAPEGTPRALRVPGYKFIEE